MRNPARSVLRDNPLLGERDGRLLLGAQALDNVAIGVSSIALPWLVLDGGGSATAAGIVYAFSVVPYVVFGLIAGVAGDRFRRRTILWTMHLTQVGAALIVPFWALSGPPPLAVILVAAFMIGTARVFVDAAVFGAISALIGRDRFVSGQATLSASWAIGYLVGPAIGGVLIAAIGPAFALVVEAVGFAIALGAILWMRRSLDPAEPRIPERAVAMAREGISVIFSSPRVRAFTWLSVTWNLGAAASYALAVPLLRDTIGLSSTQAGIVLAVSASMGLLVPLFLARLTDRHGGSRVAAGGTVGSSLSILAMGLSPGFLTVLLADAVRSLTDYVVLSTVIGERQRGVPDRLQARVGITGRMIAVTAISSGSLIGSFLAGPIGVRGVFLVSSAAVAVAGAVTLPGVLRVGHSRPGPKMSD